MSLPDRPVFHFVFLRHGESIGNVESRWQGQADYPLTEKGRAQVRSLAERWKSEGVKFDRAVTSTLIRARETAEIVASALNVKIEYDPIWMERDVGEIAGLTAEEVRKRPQRPYTTPYDPIGRVGEGDWALYLRAGQALHALLQRPAGRYLIVSHGGMLNQLMYTIVGISPHADPSGVHFRFENASFARLAYYPPQHRWVIDTLNDRAHLKSLKYGSAHSDIV